MIDWSKLASMGVTREGLERAGQLEALLRGERTDPLPLTMNVEGVAVECDARLRLTWGDEGPHVEITGVEPPAEIE